MKRNKRCEQQELTNIKFSIESHLHLKNHFLKNPVFFRTFAIFEAVIEIGISFISQNTNNFHKINPVYIGSYIASEIIDILGNCYSDFPPGYNNEF